MLTQEQIEFYHHNGYLLVENLFPMEFIEQMRQETDALIERAMDAQHSSFLWSGKWMSEEERQKKVVSGVHDPQFHSAIFGRALYHAPMAEAASDLIGPNVELHHVKLIVKPPEKGGAFPMHQDYPYFPFKNHSMMAISLHMDDANEQNGCLRVFPGSNRMGPIGTQEDGFYLDPAEYSLEKATPCPAKAGDALFFNYLTIHGSTPNISERPRRNVLFQVRAAEDEPTLDTHHSRGQGTILKGIKPLFVPSTL